ncbi:MAG: very short patch repair endonuclease, partial [Caulobacteraceae bacterium]|nr:very short patch repair endonuclease [Caulobacteraceae bacterium]
CFWHGHDCHLFKWPKTRPEFWEAKIGRNREVDADAEARLLAAGWRVATVWECAIKGRERLSLEELTTRCADWLVSGQQRLTIRGV